MRRAIPFLLVFSLVTVFVVAPGGSFTGVAKEKGAKIKDLMGSNFGQIQKILVDLVMSDYKTVAAEVALIEEHAASLPDFIPESAKANKQMFLSLAFNLQTHAKNLRTIVLTLTEREKTPNTKGELDIDYLRNTAAAHFGQLVTTCVACHNQFRRNRP